MNENAVHRSSSIVHRSSFSIIVWWVTCLIWSTVWLFIKIGVTDVPPISFAGIRLLFAVALLLPVVIARRFKLPGNAREWLFVVGTGFLLFTLNYGAVFWGAQHISSGLVAVIQAASPAFGLLVAYFVLPSEKPTWMKVISIALGVAGVAIISSDQLGAVGWAAFLGSVAVALGGFCVAISYVVVKASRVRLDPSVLMTGQMLFGAIPLMVFGLAREGNPLRFNWTTGAVVSLIYLTLLGSIAAFWLNYWLLKRMTATAVLSMSLVEPLIAVLLGAAVLDERLTPRTALGGVLVLVSIAFLLRRSR